ncbi:uncharacterized protein LOC116266431 [Nymphaea colorata]|nr:uncharacterized protein LOC116266431 [Nymphaea colorata]
MRAPPSVLFRGIACKRDLAARWGGGDRRGDMAVGVTGSAQLVAGLAEYRRGTGGSSTMIPFKAFGVASLFVGTASCTVAGVLHASGICQPQPVILIRTGALQNANIALKRLSRSIRSKLGGSPVPTQELQRWRTGYLTIIPPPGS